MNVTTLSAAVAAADTKIGVVAATGITAPVSSTGAGLTLLYVGSELMAVVGVAGTQISVLRGQGGTQAVAHALGTPVLAGTPAEFSGFAPAQGASVQVADRFSGIGAPVASATSITASGPRFHVTGNTQLQNMTPYAGFLEGDITIIFDGVVTWTTGGTAGIAFGVAGTPTTAGSTVTFTYDRATGLWYPSRLA